MEAQAPAACEVRWLSSIGSVVIRGSPSSVFIGGFLLGEFGSAEEDRGRRNVLAVTLAKAGIHLGRLATAFGISEEYLRRLRRKEETGGLGAVLLRRQGRGASKVSPAQWGGWHIQFAAGLTPMAVFREQPRRSRLSYPTVWRAFSEWQVAQPTTVARTIALAPIATPTGQLTLWAVSDDAAATAEEDCTDESDATITPMAARPVRSGRLVQHIGSWPMLALASELGLNDQAHFALGGRGDGLRIALDAIVCALAIGQGCVEGMRRRATPTGPTLLRAERVPTASGVRKLVGRLLAGPTARHCWTRDRDAFHPGRRDRRRHASSVLRRRLPAALHGQARGAQGLADAGPPRLAWHE